MTKRILSSVFGLMLSTGLVAQSISGMSPALGNQGQTLPIIISGQNTTFTQGSVSMYLRQGTSFNIIGQGNAALTAVNNTSLAINFVVPGSATLGFYDLWVQTGSSTLSKSMAFEITQPSSSASIAVLPSGSQPGNVVGATFTVSGASFKSSAQQVIEKVWLSLGSEVITDISNIQVVNSTTFTADVNVLPGTTQGLWDVNVYTDDEMMYTNTAAFDVSNTFSRKEFNNVDFKIYPNPVTTELTATFETHYSDMDIQLFDLSGKPVSRSNYAVEIQGNQIKINTEKLPTGGYMIQFISNDEVVATKKLLRQ